MQIFAGVTGRPMYVPGSSQGCAPGSAISAAVLAGAHPNFETAQSEMTALRPARYEPSAENAKVYDRLHRL